MYGIVPALSVNDDGAIQLKLSSPPFLSNPKSVMVASLPPVAPVHFPMLRAVHPEELLCLEQPKLVLEVEGAPLVFSTELCPRPGVARAGFCRSLGGSARHRQCRGWLCRQCPCAAEFKRLRYCDRSAARRVGLRFSRNGPDFAFRRLFMRRKSTFAAGETSAVTAADKISLHLQADSVVCVQGVTLDTHRETEKTTITRTPPRLLEVNLPIKKSAQGVYTLVVSGIPVRRSLKRCRSTSIRHPPW